jgi:hypothetical protein
MLLLFVLLAVLVAISPVGVLAAFTRTRKPAILLWRGLMFLFGWFAGLSLIPPPDVHDADMQTRYSLAMGVWVGILLSIVGALLLVGFSLLAVPRTRVLGRQCLLALLLIPVGAVVSRRVALWAFPEWRETAVVGFSRRLG